MSRQLDASQQGYFRANLFDEESASRIAKKIMDLYDTNRSGDIETGEAGKIISDVYSIFGQSYMPTESDAHGFVDANDADRDGRLTLKDIEDLCRKFLCDTPLTVLPNKNAVYISGNYTKSVQPIQTSYSSVNRYMTQPASYSNQTSQFATQIAQQPSKPESSRLPPASKTYSSQSPQSNHRQSAVSQHAYSYNIGSSNSEQLEKLRNDVNRVKGKTETSALLSKAGLLFDKHRGANEYIDPVSMRPVLEDIYRLFSSLSPSSEDVNLLVKAMVFGKAGKITKTEIEILTLKYAKGDIC